MDTFILIVGIGIPIAALIFLVGWLVGYNYSSSTSNWGTGFNDGWKAHKELTEIIREGQRLHENHLHRSGKGMVDSPDGK